MASDYLDKQVNAILQRELTPQKLAAKVIREKLAASGITLTEGQIERIKTDIDLNHLEDFRIDLDNTQLEQAAKQGIDLNTFRLELTESDFSRLEGQIDNLVKTLIPTLLSYTSDLVLRKLKDQQGNLLAGQREQISEFEKKISRSWGTAIDMLELLIITSFECGSEFNKEFRSRAIEGEKEMFDVLSRSHGRACKVASEILVLLKGGLADGAMARWRTLHEITTIMAFIAEHGNEIARRYLAHSKIARYKDALTYQKYCGVYDMQPIPDHELKGMKAARTKLCQEYGDGFADDYGWAAEHFKGKSPNFAEIEKAVALDHFQPYVKLSHTNIHAGSKGIVFSLGLPPKRPDLIIAGPSLFGLADPGQFTAISISRATATLLRSKSNLDRVAFLLAIKRLSDEACSRFIDAHHEVESGRTTE